MTFFRHFFRSSYQGLGSTLGGRDGDGPGTSMGRRSMESEGSVGLDPVLDPVHVDQWLTHQASPKQKKEFSSVYDR